MRFPKLNIMLASAGLALALGGCASKSAPKMSHSPVATAAETKLDVKQTAAGTAAVKFSVRHLPPANKVKEGTDSYVVWARPTDSAGVTMNLGSFKPDEKNLKAELETVTPYRKFQLFITPEKERTALAPSADPVLWTDVSL